MAPDGPVLLSRDQFDVRVERAIAEAGGLRWTTVTDSPEGETTVVRGVMVAGDPPLVHVQVEGPVSGELLDVGHTLCHQGLYTSDVPLTWDGLSEERPWNCLPEDAAVWTVVEPRDRSLAAPSRYLDGLSTNGWARPERDRVDGTALVRYAFDGHQVWLDEDDLPRRIRRVDDDLGEVVWTIERDPAAEVRLPPADQRTRVTPGFGWGHVGSCCPPVGPAPG